MTCGCSMQLLHYGFAHHKGMNFIVEVLVPQIVFVLQHLDSQLFKAICTMQSCINRMTSSMASCLHFYSEIYNIMTSQAKSGYASLSIDLLSCILSTSVIVMRVVCVENDSAWSQMVWYIQIQQFTQRMSFATDYIEKYGQRAVEAYKRSLKHADSKEKDQEGMEIGDKTHKRDGSRLRSSSYQSKSCKSINAKKQLKRSNSRSMLQQAYSKTKRTPLGHASTNNVHLNLGLMNNRKKKLVIGDISTPKRTNIKGGLMGRGQKIAGISTNVNVYVQAINRSKSKSKQSTPAKELYLNQSKQSLNLNIKPTKKHTQDELIRQINMLVDQQQLKRQSGGLKLIKQKLVELNLIGHRRQRKIHKLQSKFQKMKVLVGGQVSGGSTDRRQKELEGRVRDLEGQLEKYREKEKSLFRIVESLSNSRQEARQGGRWKQVEDEQPQTPSQEEDQHM